MSLVMKLHGSMAREFGADHVFKVSSIFEAMQVLQVNLTNFKHWVRQRHFEVLVDGKKISTDKIYTDFDGCKIDIIPTIIGAGKGILQIIAGVALIGLGFVTGFTPFYSMGAGLIFGGIAEIISPNIEDDETDQKSNLYSGPVTREARGLAVPIGIGEAMVGLKLINSKITSKAI